MDDNNNPTIYYKYLLIFEYSGSAWFVPEESKYRLDPGYASIVDGGVITAQS